MGEKETATNEEVERLKTKTKSNQSNDRLDVDDDGDGVALEKAGEEKKKEEARMAAGAGADGPQAAINNSHSNIKNLRASGQDDEGDAAEAAVNTSHSNIKNVRESGGGIEHSDDWTSDAGGEDARINNTKSNIKNSWLMKAAVLNAARDLALPSRGSVRPTMREPAPDRTTRKPEGGREQVELLDALLPAGPAPLCVGIEQEFEVWRGEVRIDFRDLIHTLEVPGVRLDPGDVNAYRLESGLALTCDEAEAELASPPIPVEPGFAGVVARHAALMRQTLQALLPEGLHVRGYSTHLSVSVPGEPDIELAEQSARTFGPLFAVLADRAESQGIYVRPRPGRLELCSDFVEGRRLEAAVAFAAGSVFAAKAGLWPETIELELFPCSERFGFRVHRRSAGFDLYAGGRGGVPGLAADGQLPLGSLFERAAGLAMAALAYNACEADLDELRAIASGVRPLGIEAGYEQVAAASPPPDLGYGLAGRSWRTQGVSIAPWRATWDYAMFEVNAGETAARYVSVPSGALPRLAALVERGVDEFAGAVSAQQPAEFTSYEQTRTPAVFASPPNDPEVLLPEEVPVTGAAKAGRDWPKAGRVGKVVAIPPILLRSPGPVPIPLAPFPPAQLPGAPETPVTSPAGPAPVPLAKGGGPPWPLIGIIGAAVLGMIAVIGVIVAGGGESQDDSPTPVTSHAVIPSVTLTPPQPTEATRTVRPSETAAPTSTVSPTGAPAGLTEAPATPTAGGETPVATSTATPQGQASETPGATATPAPTQQPTETPRPTFTPTAAATPIPTALIETPLPTPAPTATPCQGAACI